MKGINVEIHWSSGGKKCWKGMVDGITSYAVAAIVYLGKARNPFGVMVHHNNKATVIDVSSFENAKLAAQAIYDAREMSYDQRAFVFSTLKKYRN
jgi:hypothetical protein